MILKTLLLFLLFSKSLFGFYYKNPTENLHKSDELIIMKSLDIDPNFIYDEKYNELKNSISQLDIHLFVKTIQTSPSIFNTLKDIVQKSNVPDNFLYMAMIESKFLISAKSSKNAAGLWQLMPNTAKLLKLKHTKLIDERLDPIKSTKAAIKYITYLHDRFKKWYLAALAYNCGETKLAKAIKESGSDDIFTLLDKDENYLPKETQNYIRRLLIASLISQSIPVKKELGKHQKDKVILKSIKIKKKAKLEQIALKYNIKLSKVRKYNAHIKKGVVPRGYSIYIPNKNIKKQKKINTLTYKVKNDTTLLSISKKFNIPVETIKKLNKNISIFISKNEKIQLPKNVHLSSQNLKFKKISSNKQAKNKQKRNSIDENNSTMKYIVQNGDTLFILSQKFNNKISTIKRLNSHIGYDLKVGTTIILKR